MPTVPQPGTVQPEDNTAHFQGSAHNMALSTAIATRLDDDDAHTYTVSKEIRTTKHFLLMRRILAGVKGGAVLAAWRAAIIDSNVP